MSTGDEKTVGHLRQAASQPRPLHAPRGSAEHTSVVLGRQCFRRQRRGRVG
jgi:hypothetical protein